MSITYLKTIHETDKEKVLRLAEASLQAYAAFDTKTPTECQEQKIVPPKGYEFVDCWSGVDAIFGKDKTIETYGVVFRSLQAPYSYIFAFRGTASPLDAIDDLGAEFQPFTPFASGVDIPEKVAVESGFNDVYRTDDGDVPSMQQQVFQLIEKYQESDKPIAHLEVTGHSLGAAICQLFTLDLALSRPEIDSSNINFASPRVGNPAFVDVFEAQTSQKDPATQTLRVQNVYDKVPCVPPEAMGYAHTTRAYVVAFYKDEFLGKLDFLSCHSLNNYDAVLRCAAAEASGVCVSKSLQVPANGYAVRTEKPVLRKMCSFMSSLWPF